MNMPRIAIFIGTLLCIVGVAGAAHYAATTTHEQKIAWTALIPFFVGDIFVVLGVLSLVAPHLRKHLMHALAALALLGFLGSAGRLPATLSKADASPVAIASQASMALLCAIALFFCIKSFREARKARELGNA